MIARGKVRAQGTIDELRVTAGRHSRYVVEADSSKAEHALREMISVKEVNSQMIDDKWRRTVITAVQGAGDLRERIASLLSGVGCSVRELRREAPTLEHLFITMSAEAEHEAADEAKARVEESRTRRSTDKKTGVAA
jgi:ABC-type multidrug transport system ATPase subunit